MIDSSGIAADPIFERARRVIPGGVNSPVRAYGSVGGTPPFITAAHGSHVIDQSGRRYLDLVGSWGPAILGHAHPEVVAAVQQAAARGLSFGAPTPAEVELAEEILVRFERVQPGVVEQVRFVSTGTEATMTAIRLARAATGRDVILKFAGHYHGHSDGLLAEAGSGAATLGIPGSAGVPAAFASKTLVVPYQDEYALREAFAEHRGQIAAVIAESAAANMGVVAPEAGFNRLVRTLTQEEGALMITDEVLMGFRVDQTGWWGYERAHGEQWQPDLFTFGKVIGGGLPVAALAGRRELMELLAPVGPVYQAGTLSGNPVAIAAGLATMRLADADLYRRIDQTADAVVERLTDVIGRQELPVVLSRAGNLFNLFFSAELPRDYAQVQRTESWRYREFFHSMLGQGIYLPPSPFEAWFLSAAHTSEDVDRIVAAAEVAIIAAARASRPR